MSSRPTLKLIAGLGNPGARYEATRHNAGFWFVDRLAARAGVTLTQQNKFHGEAARARLDGHEVWLLKPQTFMNESGNALRALASFYKIEAEEILVAHDEVDLPAGTVRLKHGGGHGGNNGLRSICAHLGNGFTRLRLGVGRPPKGGDMTAHVLGRAGASEQRLLDDALIEAERALDILLADGREKAMHWLHSDAAAGPNPKSQPKASGSLSKEPGKTGAAGGTGQAKAQPQASAKPAMEPGKAGAADGSDETNAPPDSASSPAEADQAVSLRDQLRGLFRRGDG